MKQVRIVEQPTGYWAIEVKGWLGWRCISHSYAKAEALEIARRIKYPVIEEIK